MKIVVWGCGDYGHRILPNLLSMKDIEIVAYIDRNPELDGKYLSMFPIYSPEKIGEIDFERVLVAINNPIHFHDIKAQLLVKGYEENQIVDIFSHQEYFDLLKDQRIRFIEGYSKWIYEQNINGAVAECGVFRGDSAKYLNMFFSDRKLYLCDTYEGFDIDDLQDEKENNRGSFQESRFLDKAFFAGTSVELVMSKMPNKKQIVIKKGYFPSTMINVDEQFAFVNLDMDLYIPMLEGLKYFWSKMSPGGCILLHDYFSKDFERVQDAVRDFEKTIGKSVVKLPIGDDCSLAIICV